MNASTRTRRHICWYLLGFGILAAGLAFALLAVVRVLDMNIAAVKPFPAFADEPLPPVHPVFGTAQKTVGLDIHVEAMSRQRPGRTAVLMAWLKALAYWTLGREQPYVAVPEPIRKNLVVGETELAWSAGRNTHGYLYFYGVSTNLPSILTPLWEFAPCPKAKLSDVTSQDLAGQFVAYEDKTNGRACFGTNWLGHAIGINQGQVILARLASNPKEVYALEIAKHTQTNAVVFYIEISR